MRDGSYLKLGSISTALLPSKRGFRTRRVEGREGALNIGKRAHGRCKIGLAGLGKLEEA